MKRSIPLLFVCGLLFAACNDHESQLRDAAAAEARDASASARPDAEIEAAGDASAELDSGSLPPRDGGMVLTPPNDAGETPDASVVRDSSIALADDSGVEALDAGPDEPDAELPGAGAPSCRPLQAACLPDDGAQLWSQQIGLPEVDEYSNAITVDRAGNVYIAGNTPAVLAGTSAGSSDVFVSKYDPSRQHVWTMQFGTAGREVATAVTTDACGNVYVTGATWGDFEANSFVSEFNDVFIAKLDTDGERIWTRQLDGMWYETAWGIAAGPDGDIYITGATSSDLDGEPWGSGGGSDFFIAKYSDTGDRLWVRQPRSTILDSSRSVAVDPRGDIYITGTLSGEADEVFIMKFDASGTVQWTVQLASMRVEGRPGSSGSTDSAFGIAVDRDGNAYVVGATQGHLDGHVFAGGITDQFLVKYDTRGTKQWTRQLGSTRDDEAFGVATDANGDVYVTGTAGATFEGIVDMGWSDVTVVKYDDAGNQQWVRLLGTWTFEEPHGIATDNCGNVYVTGVTHDAFDDHVNPSPGWADGFIVRYDSQGVRN